MIVRTGLQRLSEAGTDRFPPSAAAAQAATQASAGGRTSSGTVQPPQQCAEAPR
ncbi:hypothetical protein [Kitasatospora sp. NPDC059571]|uniref:hypothetical protein n=1 Tax=Kitasatospora sp. NPDC059571 TaxID=3346871 RepID=UPI00367726A3